MAASRQPGEAGVWDSYSHSRGHSGLKGLVSDLGVGCEGTCEAGWRAMEYRSLRSVHSATRWSSGCAGSCTACRSSQCDDDTVPTGLSTKYGRILVIYNVTESYNYQLLSFSSTLDN